MINKLNNHTSSVNSLVVSDHGYIVAGSNDSTISVWDPDSGEVIVVLTNHTGAVYTLAKLSGNMIGSGSADTTIKLWDMHYNLQDSLKLTLIGHTDSVYCLYNRDRLLWSGSADGTIITWDIYTQFLEPDERFMARFTFHTKPVFFLIRVNPWNLMAGSADGLTSIWDTGKVYGLYIQVLNNS